MKIIKSAKSKFRQIQQTEISAKYRLLFLIRNLSTGHSSKRYDSKTQIVNNSFIL
jgi:hypothetical protein